VLGHEPQRAAGGEVVFHRGERDPHGDCRRA
jgi:hypothetical protein